MSENSRTGNPLSPSVSGTRSAHSLAVYACIAGALQVVVAAHATLPVTGVAPDGNGALAVTFAGRICVVGASLVESRRSGRVIRTLRLPRYVSHTGREYPHVEVLTRRLREHLVASIAHSSAAPAPSASVSTTSVEAPRFEVRSFQMSRSSVTVRAYAEVVFGEELAISCRIMEGRRGPWVAWPSIREKNGAWRQLVVFTDAAYGRDVEKELLDRYRTHLLESTGEIP